MVDSKKQIIIRVSKHTKGLTPEEVKAVLQNEMLLVLIDIRDTLIGGLKDG